MNDDIIRRIARMEAVFDKSRAAVDALISSAEDYAAVRAELKELESYYESPLWLEDLRSDREGQLPREMNRGILTEDAIYDLLTDVDRMTRLLIELTDIDTGENHEE